MLDILGDNGLVSALVAAAVIAGVGAAWRWTRDRRDAARIHAFLTESARTTKHTYRSTTAITAATSVPEERVERLCLRHPRIRRSGGEKESWTLVD